MIAFSNNVVFFNLLIFLQRLLSPIVQFNTIDILTLNIQYNKCMYNLGPILKNFVNIQSSDTLVVLAKNFVNHQMALYV